MNRQKNAGFTLLETMITVAIIGIIAALAVPSYQSMIERNQLKQAVEGLKSDLQFARTEAIKRSKDIIVSRTTGNAGAWCYGLSESISSCDCKQATAATTDDCEIKIVSGTGFSTTNMVSDSGNSTFKFRRGTIFANGVTFNTANYEARVIFSNTGRVRICTPAAANITAGKTGLPGVAVC